MDGAIRTLVNNETIYPKDYRWYITHTNISSENVQGTIRSVISGQIIYPELEWEYIPINIEWEYIANYINCTTVG